MIVKKTQNSLVCKNCKTNIHLKCSGLNKLDLSQFSTSDSNWYCKWCVTEILPFSNLDNKKLINLFKKEKHLVLPDNVISKCRVCDKGNIIRKSAVFCKYCNHLLHKKCAQIDISIIDFCSRCREDIFPFYSSTDNELFENKFNSLECCKSCSNHDEDLNITIKNTDILNLFDNIAQKDSQLFENEDTDMINNINFNFYDLHEFHNLTRNGFKNKNFSLMHSNIESINAKEDNLKTMITNLDYNFDVIALGHPKKSLCFRCSG